MLTRFRLACECGFQTESEMIGLEDVGRDHPEYFVAWMDLEYGVLCSDCFPIYELELVGTRNLDQWLAGVERHVFRLYGNCFVTIPKTWPAPTVLICPECSANKLDMVREFPNF